MCGLGETANLDAVVATLDGRTVRSGGEVRLGAVRGTFTRARARKKFNYCSYDFQGERAAQPWMPFSALSVIVRWDDKQTTKQRRRAGTDEIIVVNTASQCRKRCTVHNTYENDWHIDCQHCTINCNDCFTKRCSCTW